MNNFDRVKTFHKWGYDIKEHFKGTWTFKKQYKVLFQGKEIYRADDIETALQIILWHKLDNLLVL